MIAAIYILCIRYDDSGITKGKLFKYI